MGVRIALATYDTLKEIELSNAHRYHFHRYTPASAGISQKQVYTLTIGG